MNKNEDVCVDCYKIVCKDCGWEAKGSEVEQIKSGILKNCPICGWSPREK